MNQRARVACTPARGDAGRAPTRTCIGSRRKAPLTALLQVRREPDGELTLAGLAGHRFVAGRLEHLLPEGKAVLRALGRSRERAGASGDPRPAAARWLLAVADEADRRCHQRADGLRRRFGEPGAQGSMADPDPTLQAWRALSTQARRAAAGLEPGA